MIHFLGFIALFYISFTDFLSVLVTIALGVLRSTTPATFGFIFVELRPSSDATDHSIVVSQVVGLIHTRLLGRYIIHQFPTSVATENPELYVLVFHTMYEKLMYDQVPVGVDVVALTLHFHITHVSMLAVAVGLATYAQIGSSGS